MSHSFNLMISENSLLNQKLIQLNQQAREERRLFGGAREAERRNIAEIYQWWRAATEVEGYLEAQFEQFNYLKRREVVKAGINFDRILYLVYGVEGLTRDDKFNKIVVLNRIHSEFEDHPSAYENDTTDKLTAWIVSQGGMTALARGRETHAQDEVDEFEDDSYSDTEFDYSNSGIAFLSPEPSNPVSQRLPAVHPHVVLGQNDFIQKPGLFNEAIAACFREGSDTSNSLRLEYLNGIVNVIAVGRFGQYYLAQNVANLPLAGIFSQVYQRKYSDMGEVLAPVLETLSTQAPVLPLRASLDKLRARTGDKRLLAAAKMLVYRAREREIVLAPSSDAMGVVTIAKLKVELFEDCDGDLVLSHFARRWVEQQLLMHGHARDYVLERVDPGSDVLVVKLANRYNIAKWSYLDFWQADPGYSELVIYNLTEDCVLLAEVEMGFMCFQRWVAEHVDTWIAGYARHAGREYNQKVQFEISADALILLFDYRDATYTAKCEFILSHKSTQFGVGSVALSSQDFYISLAALSRLSSSSPVKIKLYREHCVVEIFGDLADYKVVIPRVDDFGYRTLAFAEPLILYNPSELPCNLDDYEEFDDDMRAEFNARQFDDTAELFRE